MTEALGEQAKVSRSTLSRVCEEIKTQFDAWCARRLDEVELGYLFLDGSHFKDHANAAVEPVLAAWGIDTAGERRCSSVWMPPPASPQTPGRGSWPALVSAGCATGCWRQD